jgi:hypothetical protein
MSPEKVSYCEEITSKQSAYLLKYMPYQCWLCRRFSSEILIVQCSTLNAELESCNSPICLQCSTEFYEFLRTNQESSGPLEECGFCHKSLIIGEADLSLHTTVNHTGRNLLSQHSRFSNIEELDAEHETESEEDE